MSTQTKTDNGKKITFYNSMEELKEKEYQYLAGLSMAERIENTVELIKRVYGFDPSKAVKPTRIRFIKV